MRACLLRSPFTLSCLLFVALAANGADDKPGSHKARRDPAGLSAQMGQFRSLFAAWDLNQDGFLDKTELARAFRGASAKPYAPVPGSAGSPKSLAHKYPDHEFLIQLDQNNDGKISRAEFMDWARSYLEGMKKYAARESRLSQKEKQLKEGNLSADEKKKISEEIKFERKALAEQKKELKHLETIEKHLQRLK
jgi:hypothetical protein